MSDELSEAIAALEARLAACPKQERDYPDYEAYQAAIKAWHKLQPPIATLQSRVQWLRSESQAEASSCPTHPLARRRGQ